MMDRGAVGMLEKVVLEISLDGGIGEYVCRDVVLTGKTINTRKYFFELLRQKSCQNLA